MLKNKRLWVIAVTLFFFLVIATPAALALISSRAEHMIKIAYMNGYVAALQKDPETIEKMKKDRAFLKKTVEKDAETYMDRVRKMNL